MVTEDRIAWLLRRAGFGAAPGELEAAVAAGVPATLDRLVDPDAHGVPPAPDPWDPGLLLGEPDRPSRIHAIDGWLERMRTSPRQLVERMAWVWHDHFATSLAKVRFPILMVTQVRTLHDLALAPFPVLLRAMTIDAAMLLWLDGNTSTREAPNENHGRELLELFSVGVDNHTEADVAAAARALTGWVVERGTGRPVFRPRRHDDRPAVLLGREVHDVDTVVDAVCASPACPPYVTGALARHLLGPAAADDAELVGDLAADFRASGLDVRRLVRALLEAGLDRAGTEVVEAPVPWLVRAERATGARLLPVDRTRGLLAAGHVPMAPPDVGGWPDHTSWLASGTVLARASLAARVAAGTPAGTPARVAARAGDHGALARALGTPRPLSAATRRALDALPSANERLALALCCPEAVVV